jgi:hypothetical protein
VGLDDAGLQDEALQVQGGGESEKCDKREKVRVWEECNSMSLCTQPQSGIWK